MYIFNDSLITNCGKVLYIWWNAVCKKVYNIIFLIFNDEPKLIVKWIIDILPCCWALSFLDNLLINKITKKKSIIFFLDWFAKFHTVCARCWRGTCGFPERGHGTAKQIISAVSFSRMLEKLGKETEELNWYTGSSLSIFKLI